MLEMSVESYNVDDQLTAVNGIDGSNSGEQGQLACSSVDSVEAQSDVIQYSH